MRLIALCLLLAVSLNAEPLRVLTYSSFLGKDSAGEKLKEAFEKKHPGMSLVFESSKDLTGLLGALRSRQDLKNYDVVLGLGESEHAAAVEEGLILPGAVFERGPFAIVINQTKFKESKLPTSWSELGQMFAGKMLLPDPRFSSAGEGWIRALYEHRLIDPREAQKVVKTVFPSWSAAYGAFVKGDAPAVWSYLTSEAYHLCQGEKNFRVLNLKEGYPVQREFVARTSKANHKEVRLLLEFVMSEGFQKELPSSNWMFPASDQTPLPPCYSGITKIQTIPSKTSELKTLQKWMDQWSLL